jgi:hypothetical protein
MASPHLSTTGFFALLNSFFGTKLRQLRDVRRDPPRLVTAEQLGSRSPSRFLTAEPALRRLVMILQRDHQAFHGT